MSIPRDLFISRKFGTNLRRLLSMNDVSATLLGEWIHRSPKTVSSWMLGNRLPDAVTIVEICRVLRVTPNDLFKGC